MSTVGTPSAAATLLAEPHHDGSDLHVLELPDDLGGEAVLRLRMPRETPLAPVAVRYMSSGEQQHAIAEIDEETETDRWWRAAVPVTSPVVRYRWALGDRAVTALGVVGREVPDADDFVLTVGAGGPDWHLGSVVYQIFPDRFASSGLDVELPDWAVRREWDGLPTGRGRDTPYEYFGGDLYGIAERLEHVEQLGANVIYLTPIFPARSTHRYDATTFDRVDPLLGGEDGLRALAEAAHARGIRLVGDLTLNHVGNGHEWFPQERDFFYFDESERHGYAAWWGIKTLPKLNWGSGELRTRMLAVYRRWLDEGLDGWRIDVANMTGRRREDDFNQEVARLFRGALDPDELLVAEHGYDYRPDLDGRGWHGVMNYAGFLRPVWSWLRADDLPAELEASFWGTPFGLFRRDGIETVAQMRHFRSGIPWQAAVHSWTLLDSHDTSRFRSVSGSRAMHEVGIGLQMTTPGVPMVFAGDELGLEGEWGEDARRTMPWERRGEWDDALLASYRALIALRRSSAALARGGIRYAYVGPDAIAYLRETAGESLLCLAARAAHDPIHVPFTSLETLYGEDAHGGVLPADGPSFHVWRIHG